MFKISVQTIYANKTIGITDLKRDSIKAYLIPEKLMAAFANYLEDVKLSKIANKRLKDLEEGKTTTIAVDADDL